MKTILENVRRRTPLVHFITNYVTVNDVANMMLACGGSPIMSDDKRDVEDITTICNALVINIGTLNERSIESMILAGKRANALGHPVILDPVGAGASKFRTETTFRLLEELKTVYSGSGSTKGVDADVADTVTEDNLKETAEFARQLSKTTGAIIAMTGAIDVIADEEHAYAVRNGVAEMSKITGTGCMLDGVIAGYVAANMENQTNAVVAAIVAEGLCGEIAGAKVKAEGRGTSSLRMYLIDAMSNLDGDTLVKGAKVEEI